MFCKNLFGNVCAISLRSYSQFLNVGDQISVKRRITADDLKLFTELTKDTNPIHQDSKEGIVHGAFLNSLVAGVIGTKLPGSGTIVVEQHLKFPKPCYVNNEVTICVTVASLRKIIEVHFEVFGEDNRENKDIYLMGSAKLLIPWKDSKV